MCDTCGNPVPSAASVAGADTTALNGAFDCLALAVLLHEAGDNSGALEVLMDCAPSFAGAFPARSPEADALGVILAAVAGWLTPSYCSACYQNHPGPCGCECHFPAASAQGQVSAP